MSRIKFVRSITFTSNKTSIFLSCDGVSSSSNTTRSMFSASTYPLISSILPEPKKVLVSGRDNFWVKICIVSAPAVSARNLSSSKYSLDFSSSWLLLIIPMRIQRSRWSESFFLSSNMSEVYAPCKKASQGNLKAIKNKPTPNQSTTGFAFSASVAPLFDFALPMVINTAAIIIVIGCSTYLKRKAPSPIKVPVSENISMLNPSNMISPMVTWRWVRISAILFWRANLSVNVLSDFQAKKFWTSTANINNK